MKIGSPYLEAPNRLADVIAAIQATATYKFYKLTFAGWADRIAGDERQADHWRQVFEEHPEFFRLDSARERVSLVWRRQHQKRCDVDASSIITKDDYEALTDNKKQRISRTPLGTSEIATPVQTAANLHSRALEHKKENHWWVPVATGLVGSLAGFAGAILGAYISGSAG